MLVHLPLLQNDLVGRMKAVSVLHLIVHSLRYSRLCRYRNWVGSCVQQRYLDGKLKVKLLVFRLRVNLILHDFHVLNLVLLKPEPFVLIRPLHSSI